MAGVACVLAPHFFKVHSADGDVASKNSVDLCESRCHNGDLIVVATDVGGRVDSGADGGKHDLAGEVKGSGCFDLQLGVVDLCSVGARAVPLFRAVPDTVLMLHAGLFLGVTRAK